MSPFSLVQRRSEQVAQLLRQQLSHTDAGPGAKLPPERTLATDLQVSRRVLREALQQLEEEGLIQRIPGRGTVIVDKTLTSPYDAVNLRQYTSPIELMDARFALEPAIAAMAAAHATSEDIDEMRLCIEKSSRATDHTVWEKWDGALHWAIGKSTHNSLLVRFFTTLTAAREQTAWGRLRKASLTQERQQLYTDQHTKIVAAIEERNPEHAALMMRQHLITVKRTLIDQLDEI